MPFLAAISTQLEAEIACDPGLSTGPMLRFE